jgi:hypothetical protein
MNDFISGLFGSLICIIENLLLSLLAIGYWLINGLIKSFAFLLGPLIALMPAMPTPPALPGVLGQATGWIAWVFPTSTVTDILTFLLAVYVLWLIVSMFLRWARAGGLHSG